MRPPLAPIRLLAPLCLLFSWNTTAPAQIAAATDSSKAHYAAKGMTDQPFTVEVLDARRTVSNSLLVRLALTNHGTAPLRAGQDFSSYGNPADANKISALYAVDPNGQTKYPVLRDAHGQALCSRLVPDLKPGERRTVYAQLFSPPDTSSSVKIVFPRADPILRVPIGLPQAGEPIPPEATIGDPGSAPAPAAPVPIAPSAAIDQPTSNNLPDVYTNQTQIVGSGTPLKGIGSIDSSNSTVPYTIEVLGLKATPAGATLRLAITNNGSGILEAAGQFTTDIAASSNARQINAVYLLDPVGKERFQVAAGTETNALSKIDPALGPGERRALEVNFPAIPPGVKTVYVYFPHTTPIPNVPVIR